MAKRGPRKTRSPRPGDSGTGGAGAFASLVKSQCVDLVSDDGETSELRLNLLRAPEPDRTLFANWVGAVADAENVDLVFGQRAPGAPRLAGALVVSVPVSGLRGALYEGNPGFVGSLKRAAKTHGYHGAVGDVSPDIYPTERLVFERAGLLSMAFAGPEAELRFYRISASDVRKIRDGHSATLVHPVVQVLITTGSLSALVDHLSTLLPAQEGAPVTEAEGDR